MPTWNVKDPIEQREVGLVHLEGAAARLEEVAAELRARAKSDRGLIAQHGARYASDPTAKVTLVQWAQAANADIARAQRSLFEAVAEASLA